MAASYPEASPPPVASSTFVPLSPRPYWAGQGTRLPYARLQHKAESGEGKSRTGVHSRGGSPAQAMRRRPSGGTAQLQRPQSWVLRVFRVLKPTSRNLPLPARPGSPGAAREKPKVPEPPSCVPRTALISSLLPPRTSAPPTPAPVPAPAPLCPNLPECKGPSARAPRRWGCSLQSGLN